MKNLTEFINTNPHYQWDEVGFEVAVNDFNREQETENKSEIIVDYKNKTVSIGNKQYKLIYRAQEQIGDCSTEDMGYETMILFDGEKHFKLSSDYETYYNEESGCFDTLYKEWKLETIE